MLKICLAKILVPSLNFLLRIFLVNLFDPFYIYQHIKIRPKIMPLIILEISAIIRPFFFWVKVSLFALGMYP